MGANTVVGKQHEEGESRLKNSLDLGNQTEAHDGIHVRHEQRRRRMLHAASAFRFTA